MDDLRQLLIYAEDDKNEAIAAILYAIVTKQFFPNEDFEDEDVEPVVDCNVTGQGDRYAFLMIGKQHIDKAQEIADWVLGSKLGESPFFQTCCVNVNAVGWSMLPAVQR